MNKKITTYKGKGRPRNTDLRKKGEAYLKKILNNKDD